jgi:DNA-directed RNA polymerase sigma subunit (sigma70/sigma32)
MEQATIDRIIKFWKELEYELIIEEKRYELYKEKYKSIEASVEYERSIQMSAMLQNQEAYVRTLKIKQRELIAQLNGFVKTLDDKEGFIFVNSVITYTRSLNNLAEVTGYSVEKVRTIRDNLLKDLNAYWELNPKEGI